MSRTSLTKSAPSRTFCLSFLLLLRTPLGLRSCAWLMIALASFYFFPLHVHPTGSAHSVHHFGLPTRHLFLADHDEFFELPAPREGGSPIQGSDHCCAGSCSRAGTPAWAPPCFCRNCPRRQNSW